MIAPAARQARGAGSPGRSAARCSTRCRWAFHFYSRIVAPWIEEALKGSALVAAVLLQPHRLQARRDHLRLRHRRRFLGDREYLLPVALPGADRAGVDGARAGHGGDARHDHRHSRRAGPRTRASGRCASRRGHGFNPLDARSRLRRREPDPHAVQPVPGPADGGDDRHADRRAGGPARPASVRRERDPPMADGGKREPSAVAGGMARGRLSVRRQRPEVCRAGGPGDPGGGGADPRLLHAQDRAGGDRRGRIARPGPQAGGGRGRPAARGLRPARSDAAGAGQVGHAAVRRNSPFSSNDEWELAELKELVDRD